LWKKNVVTLVSQDKYFNSKKGYLKYFSLNKNEIRPFFENYPMIDDNEIDEIIKSILDRHFKLKLKYYVIKWS
jgi:hypothetical protein